ncbi:MAG TPA: hypothetical protein VGM51_11330 [Armatimonadota bacterium]
MQHISFQIFILLTFCAAVAAQAVCMRFGRGFRSAERKAGTYRAGGGQGQSSKLPMTGGPVMIVMALAAGLVASRVYWSWPRGPWEIAVALAGYGVVGFLDDFGKHRGRGLSQRLKTLGCLLVSGGVAASLCRVEFAEAFSVATVARWAVETAFLFCFAVAADFSDGVDGLAGGLGLAVCCAMGAAAILGHRAGASVWAIGVSVILAFLVFNLPSAWTSRGTARRRARVYLGDSGALAMGGGLAAAALWMHLGWVFIPAAAVWALEGFSSAWQAEFLVKLVYRRFGRVERYGKTPAPHTEFPLPLLAAPIHHHFEVAGWDRMQVWKLLMATAVVCACGAAVTALFGVRMLVGYGIAGAACVALWALAGIYRTFYLSVGDGGRLVLSSGLPFRLRGRRFHKVVRITELDAAGLTADQRMWLYRPMPRPDAMEMLVRLLAGAGCADEARELAATLPPAMRAMRLADVVLEEPAQ